MYLHIYQSKFSTSRISKLVVWHAYWQTPSKYYHTGTCVVIITYFLTVLTYWLYWLSDSCMCVCMYVCMYVIFILPLWGINVLVYWWSCRVVAMVCGYGLLVIIVSWRARWPVSPSISRSVASSSAVLGYYTATHGLWWVVHYISMSLFSTLYTGDAP